MCMVLSAGSFSLTDKPQRDMIFTDKLIKFEQICNNISMSVDIARHLHMIPSLHKADTIKTLMTHVSEDNS